MSVMNGFEKELQDRILGVVPHAVITSDKPITNFSNLIDQIKIEPEILEAAPYISFQGLISSAVSNKGVSITGIDILTEDKMSILPDYMKYGSIESLSETNSIIIGSWLASYLDVSINDSINVTTSNIRSSIIGSYPRSASLKVVGIFELRAEIDQSLVLISHALAQKFKGFNNETESIRIKTSNLFEADRIAFNATNLISSADKAFYLSLIHI